MRQPSDKPPPRAETPSLARAWSDLTKEMGPGEDPFFYDWRGRPLSEREQRERLEAFRARVAKAPGAIAPGGYWAPPPETRAAARGSDPGDPAEERAGVERAAADPSAVERAAADPSAVEPPGGTTLVEPPPGDPTAATAAVEPADQLAATPPLPGSPGPREGEASLPDPELPGGSPFAARAVITAELAMPANGGAASSVPPPKPLPRDRGSAAPHRASAARWTSTLRPIAALLSGAAVAAAALSVRALLYQIARPPEIRQATTSALEEHAGASRGPSQPPPTSPPPSPEPTPAGATAPLAPSAGATAPLAPSAGATAPLAPSAGATAPLAPPAGATAPLAPPAGVTAPPRALPAPEHPGAPAKAAARPGAKSNPSPGPAAHDGPSPGAEPTYRDLEY